MKWAKKVSIESDPFKVEQWSKKWMVSSRHLRKTGRIGKWFPPRSNPLLGGILSTQWPCFKIYSFARVAVKRSSMNACSISCSIAYTSASDVPGSVGAARVESASSSTPSDTGFIWSASHRVYRIFAKMCHSKHEMRQRGLLPIPVGLLDFA